jgi:hypothetical protein
MVWRLVLWDLHEWRSVAPLRWINGSRKHCDTERRQGVQSGRRPCNPASLFGLRAAVHFLSGFFTAGIRRVRHADRLANEFSFLHIWRQEVGTGGEPNTSDPSERQWNERPSATGKIEVRWLIRQCVRDANGWLQGGQVWRPVWSGNRQHRDSCWHECRASRL